MDYVLNIYYGPKCIHNQQDHELMSDLIMVNNSLRVFCKFSELSQGLPGKNKYKNLNIFFRV